MASKEIIKKCLLSLFWLGASQWSFGQCPSLTIVPQVTNASCGILNDGQISVQVQGGKTPYAYHWSNGAKSSTANGLAQGTYTVTVTDAAGCAATLTQTVDTQQSLQITTQSTNPTTGTATDGMLEVNVAGGAAPYTFQVTDYSDVRNIRRFSSDRNRITRLRAGRYAIDVVDAKGCIDTHMVVLGN